MRPNLRKAITFILVLVFLFSSVLFSTASFAAHEKISADLKGKIKIISDSTVPVIVQTKHGLKERHKDFIRTGKGITVAVIDTK